jgi:NTP pyrophosphatase (non-canonical NTP hydrolase)
VQQQDILKAMIAERRRQDMLHPDNDVGDYLSIIIEEIGEVAKAMQGEGNIQEELIQVGATAIRWLESL